MSNSEFCSIYVLDMALGNLSAKVQPVFLFFFFEGLLWGIQALELAGLWVGLVWVLRWRTL